MNATSAVTIEHMHYIFTTYGLPKMLVSDNGSIFTSTEYTSHDQFIKHNGIQHVKPAPYHAASNGLAERAVQTFKAFMKSTAGTINTCVLYFLSQYRITPHVYPTWYNTT